MVKYTASTRGYTQYFLGQRNRHAKNILVESFTNHPPHQVPRVCVVIFFKTNCQQLKHTPANEIAKIRATTALSACSIYLWKH